MSAGTYTHDTAFAALCIMEELIDSTLKSAPTPWAPYWEQVGVNEIRCAALQLAPECDAAWSEAYRRFEAEEIGDPGSFDYEFVPIWLRHNVEWFDNEAPRVRNPKRAPAEAVGSSDNLLEPVLACPSCRDSTHLYDRADVRYDPEARDWVVGDREGTIECTECDWTGAEDDLLKL